MKDNENNRDNIWNSNSRKTSLNSINSNESK